MSEQRDEITLFIAVPDLGIIYTIRFRARKNFIRFKSDRYHTIPYLKVPYLPVPYLPTDPLSISYRRNLALEFFLTFEEPPGVLLLEGEELPGGGANLGQAVLHAPNLTLVPQPILA